MKKRILCLLLSIAMLIGLAPNQIPRATAQPVPLSEAALPAEILANDVFYLASTNAAVYEGKNENYLLRVGRGGSADTESSVLDGSAEVSVPEDNPSLMDRILGQPFTVTELKDEEEAEAEIAEDPEAKAAAAEGLKTVMDYLGNAVGLGTAAAAEIGRAHV